MDICEAFGANVALGPLEGVGILVVRLNEAVNGLAHLPRIREARSPQRSAAQDREPDLHLVQPRGENGGAKLDHRAANRSCFWAE